MKNKQRREEEAEKRTEAFRAEFPTLQSRLDSLLKDTSDFSHAPEIARLRRKIEKGKALLANEKKGRKSP
jgi:ElaB/YqjD/DUF883 family membrane-anchored ribosome-binding protein